jgi:chemotaxis signal transduction protein
MAGTDSLKLVARLSGAGLLFNIADLLEVVAVAEAVWEPSDSRQPGDIRFRDGLLPVYAMRDLLDWGDPASTDAGSILVFRQEDRNWGALVDEVSGIFPSEEFEFHELPPLLRHQGPQVYRRLALWNGEPLICCDHKLLALQQVAA